MSSAQSGESQAEREKLVEADIVDCMVALPGQLFYSTPIPACLWFLARDRTACGFRNRSGEILFIDARKLGRMVDRTHRELTEEDIARITDTYHAWRGKRHEADYTDEPGFCKSVALIEIREHEHVLTPGRYVGTAPKDDDGELLEEQLTRLTSQLHEHQVKGRELDIAIEANLKALGYS